MLEMRYLRSIIYSYSQNFTYFCCEQNWGKPNASNVPSSVRKGRDAASSKRPRRVAAPPSGSDDDFQMDWRDEYSDELETESGEDEYLTGRRRASTKNNGPRSIMLLTGPPGSGKTASVYACAQELGCRVLEINTSIQRSGKALRDLFGEVHKVISLVVGIQLSLAFISNNLKLPYMDAIWLQATTSQRMAKYNLPVMDADGCIDLADDDDTRGICVNGFLRTFIIGIYYIILF